jgi:thioredoxin-like negative regulator of GroEL
VYTVRGVSRRWRDRVRRTGWVLIGIGVLALGCWVVLRAVGAPNTDVFNGWVGWANIFALPVGALGTALVTFDNATRRRSADQTAAADQPVERVKEDLAVEVERVWAREATLRRVDNRPAPVTVRWSSTERPAARRSTVLDDPGADDWRQLPLSGDLTEIVDAFRDLPHRQLLILGDPGAGKSVLANLLTLGLLRRPESGQPVPLLLPINDWDPTQTVDSFVIQRLVADYGDVLACYGDPQVVSRQLVRRRGGVLPILDGLDELPAGRHKQALDAIDCYAARDLPVVVTCRGWEYEQAVTRGQTLLSRAAVIEIEPVSAEAAIAFLSHPELAQPRWQPVFDALREHPDGPLAAALSTPLMVALARTAYEDPATDPTDLLDVTTRSAIGTRLMDAFIASVYTTPADARDGGRPARAYRPARAAKWLGCLAYHLYTAGTRDLHWWQIPPDLLTSHPRRARDAGPLIITIAAAVIAGILGGTVGGVPSAAAAAACAVGLAGGTAAGWFRRLWPTSYPPFISRGYRTRRRRQREELALRAAHGLVCGLLAGMLSTPAVTAMVATMATIGMVCGLITARTPPSVLSRPAGDATPTRSLRHNHRNATAAALYSGGISGVLVAVSAWLVATTSQIALPATVTAGVFAAAAALGAGGWTWVRFRLTHARLALHGWLPWRLEAFYHDAHHRGVLRQAGLVYQFRHALLQDHLASVIHLRQLRTRADAGDGYARNRLAELLVQHGRLDEAIAIWRPRADTGDGHARNRLAELLVRQGRLDEPIAIWRAHADAGDGHARNRLAELLARQGRVDELRARADTGDGHARNRLVELLVKQGRVNELQSRADDGDRSARNRLADLLVQQGRVDEAIAIWRAPADAGDGHARERLVELLLQHGRIDEATAIWRARPDAGDCYAVGPYARERLAESLVQHGRVDEAIALWRARADAGDWYAVDWYATERLVELLVQHGRIDELRARAGAGDRHARNRLAELLVRHGRVDEAIAIWRARADAGDGHARERLAELLVQQHRVDEAIVIWRARADAGDGYARERLVESLVQQGYADELQARADAGDGHARKRLTALLAQPILRHGPHNCATSPARRADGGLRTDPRARHHRQED